MASRTPAIAEQAQAQAARADAERAKAEAQKAKAEASEAQAEFQKARAEAASRVFGPQIQTIPQRARELLIKALRMLGSERDALIAKNPDVGSYRYLRGKALANTKRYAEAVEDYKSAIQLQKDPRDVGDWVFVELANLYAAMGRPCDAATTILAWVAIDSSVRNTLNARKMVEAYSAKGCAQNPAPTDLKKL